jgi:hypothetical protein
MCCVRAFVIGLSQSLPYTNLNKRVDVALLHCAGNGHMDGVAIHGGPHDDDPDLEAPIQKFTCLAGVALSDQLEPNCGNFAILPQSHLSNSRFFAHQREHGGPLGPGGYDWPLEPWAREPGSNASRGSPPHLRSRMIPPPTRSLGGNATEWQDTTPGGPATPRHFPSGEQQLLRRGDVVLAHFLTCHGEMLVHGGDRSRDMVFFRVHHKLSEPYRPERHELDDESRRAVIIGTHGQRPFPPCAAVKNEERIFD